MTNDQLTLKIDRARWHCLQAQSFYGNLCMGLKDSIGTFPGITTAATDGRRIYWDKDFLAKLTDEETRFVLLHETMHPGFQHLWRLTRDELGNIAGDYEINLLLSKIPGISMPKGGLLDKQWEGKACEEIYAALARQPKQPQPKPGSGGDPGGCGGFMEPAPDDGKAEIGKQKSGNGSPGNGKIGAQTLKEEWEQRVIQAAQSAKASGQGSIPGEAERLLNRMSRTDIDWRQELADFPRTIIGGRSDWSRSNRRCATQPVIYPRHKKNEVGIIVGWRDSSGSICDGQLSEFTALLAGAAAEMGATLILLDCDAKIQAERRIEPGDEIPLNSPGGGGTSFLPIKERVEQLIEEGEDIAGVVGCTDLEGDEFDEISVPILWLCTTDRIAKTGRTVRIL